MTVIDASPTTATNALTDDVALKRRDTEVAQHVESVIGLALSEALAERDALKAQLASIRESVSNDALKNYIEKHGSPVPLIEKLNAALAERDALKARIDSAPAARVQAPSITESIQLRDADPATLRLHDRRVRLVVEL